MTREEIIAVIKQTAEELGHVPTVKELKDRKKLKKHLIRSRFGTYRAALAACGLERKGPGHQVSMEALFLDWAGVARRLEKIPNATEYGLYGKHCVKVITRHVGGWPYVAEGMLRYARERGLEEDWKDVMEAVARHLEKEGSRPRSPVWASGMALGLRIMKGEPVYGPPTGEAHLMMAPTNEQGVIFLFGAVARKLGFAVLMIRMEYPDCEAMREIEPERWQRVRIEFEYESRNFLAHGHSPEKCHLIVCWRHNWEESPLEVVELKSLLPKLSL